MLELLFPIHLRETMKGVEKLPDLEEIRVRIGQPIFVYTGQKELVLIQTQKYTESPRKCEKGCDIQGAFQEVRQQDMYAKAYRVTEQDLLEMQNYISNYSLYAWQEELKNGFLTIQGGHRIGLAGGTTGQNGRISGISYLTFFNIRVAHERIGCAKKVLPLICIDSAVSQNLKKTERDFGIHNTLIVSPPGAGKTTFLRDCIRSLSYGEIPIQESAYSWGNNHIRGMKIGLVDERSEIAACYHGIPQNDMGPRTDVLDGCNKPEGIQMLLRTMSPEVIAVDELGTEEDFKAVEQAAYSGCKVIGTIHAGNIMELQEKPVLKKWCEKELFERYVYIEKGENGVREFKIYNNRWELL